MSFGLWEIFVVAVLALLAFGPGRIPGIMGNIAKGIRNFKKEIGGDRA